MSNEVDLNKQEKLKKGDMVKVKGKDYVIDELRDIQKDSDSGKIRGREFSFKKEEGEGNLKGKVVLMQNEKTGEAKFYRGVEEREVSPGSFRFKSIQSMVYRRVKNDI